MPALSVASAVKVSPLVFGGLIATLKLPSWFAVPVPIIVLPSLMVTVAPGSVLPDT
nr:hypothetical protein [Gallibacterium genomosp. 3]